MSKSKDIPSVPLSTLPSKVRTKLSKLVEQKLSIDDQISELELTKKALQGAILDLTASNSLLKVESELEWRVSIQTRISRKLSPIKLAEKGVSLKVIEECTKVTTSKPFVVVERV